MVKSVCIRFFICRFSINSNVFYMNLTNRHQSKKDRAWLFEASAYCNLLINHLDKINRTNKKQSEFMLNFTEKTIDFKNAIDGNYFQTENNYIVEVVV